MRGKKSDIDFVSDFISECTEVGKDSPELIVNEAKARIQQIDLKIKEVELLKSTRSKLLDVISTFDEVKLKVEQTKDLQLFNIKNHHICKPICLLLQDKPIKLNDICTKINVNAQDILFCIKQLLEYKVVSKTGDFFLRGIKFEEYMKDVLLEK